MTDLRVPPAPAGTSHPPGPATDLPIRLVIAAIALVPLAVGWVLWAAPGADADFNRRITIAPFDLPLLVLSILWAGARLADRTWLGRRRSAGGTVALVFGVAFAVAFAAHPSGRGVDLAVRLVAAVAIADIVASATAPQLRRLCIVIVGAGVVEAVLAVAQSVHGEGFALYPLDHTGPLFSFGTAHAGRGGLSHPYHLTVFLLLGVFAGMVGGRRSAGRERVLWAVALAVLGAGMAVTFSRAMVLAVAPTAALWFLAARRPSLGPAVRGLVAALVAGLAVTSLVFASGWHARADQSTSTGADRGRSALARTGLDMAADEPLTGVGPARYVLALAERGEAPETLLPAHNVVVHALAELGVLGGLSVAAALALGARGAARRGALVLGGAWLLVPFVVLDAYPYVFPTGLVISAVWIGLARHPSLSRRSARGPGTTQIAAAPADRGP